MTTLPNGLRVVTETMAGVRSLAVGCWVNVGNRDEPEHLSGVSHFCEHLLFKGTESRPARHIAELVDATGGDMNAFTTKEYTAFYLRVPATDGELAIDILGDVITSPALRPSDVASEGDVILEELHLQLDEPDDLVHTELTSAMYPDHALGREILGTEETISAMTAEMVSSFHREWYRPANLVVAAVGPFEHQAIVDRVASWFTSGPRGVAPVRQAPATVAPAVRILNRAVESVHLALGWPAFGHHDPDRHALALLNQILGGGMSSRLFQQIREERGLAYTVFSSMSGYHDAGMFSVYAGTSKARVGEVLDVVRAEVVDLVANGVTEHELKVAKGAFAGSTVINLEDTGSRMARLATGIAVRGVVTPIDEFLLAIDAVDHDAIRRVAGRVLGDTPTLAVVGPLGRTKLAW